MAASVQIQPRKPVRDEVLRVANALISGVLRHLDTEGVPSEEAVHEARKTLKRLRALARLVRGAIPRQEFRIANQTFRDAKNSLGGLRDAKVRLNTLAALRAGRNGTAEELESQAGKARACLEAELDEAATRHTEDSQRIEDVMRMLTIQRERIELWDLRDGFVAFRDGVLRTYSDGYDAFKELSRKPSVHNAHELRKRVKDLMYEIEFLERVWKRPLGAYRAELDRLSDYLGDDHDLAVLEESIGELNLPKVKTLIERKAGRLRSRALLLGAKTYVRKPGAFVRELATAWEIERRR